MRTIHAMLIALTICIFSSCSGEKSIDIFATTDVHGMLLPYDFTEMKATKQSFSNIAYIRDSVGRDKSIFIDNGDILQGDPLVYFYNYVDTTSEHVVSQILNEIGYDAAVAGNHDIETGHKVYDRVRGEYDFPLLAANAINTETGEPYFEPYVVIRRNGLKVIVFGLITSSVPEWLPASLYSGIRFENMKETAMKWMPEMKRQKPDLIIGLFHSGVGGEQNGGENNSMEVAVNVPGFDIVFAGHDHGLLCKKVADIDGDSVLVIDGGSRSAYLMHARVKISADGSKIVEGENIRLAKIPESKAFNESYKAIADTIKSYTDEKIGFMRESADTRDAFFGPSAFVDLIHQIQLSVSGADISFAAPLSFDATIDSGDFRVCDLFKLYRFENYLYTVRMTGREIDAFLEHSYAKWMNTMKSSSDYMLKYKEDENGKPLLYNGRVRLGFPSYNFDSADGIIYTVNLLKPEGDRVNVSKLKDGRSFSADSVYLVAVNSYRASGGGGHFPAAGISRDILAQRIVFSTPRDLRYYISEWISDIDTVSPKPSGSWSVLPAAWVKDATERETKLLFGE